MQTSDRNGLDQAVEHDEGGDGVVLERVVGEADDDEQDREHGEAHELDRLAAPPVDEDEGDPVAGDEAGDREDDVADADVAPGASASASGL